MYPFTDRLYYNTIVMVGNTDYGRPMEPFFIEIQNFWAWADKLGR